MNTDSPEQLSITTGESVLPKIRATKPLDYEIVKTDCDEKSVNIIEALVLLYLPVDFIERHEYVFQKMNIDKMIVSNLLFQMKTAEHAIKKLLEEIDGGNIQPRVFEVLASLQRSKMEIVKHIATFMVTLENNYKNLKYDYVSSITDSVMNPRQISSIDDEDDIESTRFRGTKSLMSIVQNTLNPEDNGKTIE